MLAVKSDSPCNSRLVVVIYSKFTEATRPLVKSIHGKIDDDRSMCFHFMGGGVVKILAAGCLI